MARNHRIARRVVSVVSSVALALSLCPFGQAFAIEAGEGQPSGLSSAANGATDVDCLDVQADYYVKSGGDDSDGNPGDSPDSPLASLSEAVDRCNESEETDVTICVVGKVTSSVCARITDNAGVDKNVKIVGLQDGDGTPATIVRSENFSSISDVARSWYNPALVEATSPEGHDVTLTLQSIVLDDAGKHEGELFKQAASVESGESDNLKCVQDAIVAGYGTDYQNPNVNIILGDGAVLRDFGGMSAVRVTGGASLTMQAGSLIKDVEVTDRSRKGDEDFGPAGAVWVQGTSVTMLENAQIDGIVGRVFYLDGGNATLDGTLSDVKSDDGMWWGTSGFFIHLRGGAKANIGMHGVIDGGGINSSGTAIGVLSGCELTTVNGSVIKGLNNGTGIDARGTVTLGGEITGCCGWKNVINAPNGDFHITVGPTAYIHDNQCNYGVVYAQSETGVIDIYGKINDNISNDRAGAIAMANNFSGTKVNMYDGAEICGNVSYQTGGGIMVSCGTFTMYGGTISGNISGVGDVNDSDKAGGGVFVRRGGQFVMNSGTISNNAATGIGGNIAFEAEVYRGMAPFVQLHGGIVTNGIMDAEAVESSGSYSTTGGMANDIAIVGGSAYHGSTTRYLSVSNDLELSEQSIFMDDYDFYIENPGADVKLGNASAEAKDAAKKKYEGQGLSVIKGSFWYETDNDSQSFTVSSLQFDDVNPLYAAIVPTDDDGKPNESSAILCSVSTESDGSFSLSLPGQNAGGYAVVFLQQAPASPNPKVVTVTPADITVYEGGDGYSAVVDGSGNKTENSMPHPMFRIAGIDDASGLAFENESQGKSWTAIFDGGGYYHFKPAEGQDEVRVTYTNAEGESVVSDKFDVSSVNETFTQFSVGLYLGDNNVADITASNGGIEYAVALGTGTLTVRAVQSDPDDAVIEVSKTVPNEPLAVGTVMAVEPTGGTVYTLNNTGVELPDDSEPSLLFDSIIEDEGSTVRTDALKSKADEVLGAVGVGDNRCYEMKYLDLVDAKNSNAWIKSSEGVDVYWAYPEGTDESTDFSLLHFEGLHRDGENSGFDVGDISNSTVEKVEIQTMPAGIKFHVDAGGFSPFALVWTEDGGGSVTPPQPQTVTLHYETNGGRPLADEEHVIGTKADLKTPLREGCTFAGWYLDSALTKPAESPLLMDSDKTVWAKWESTSVPGDFTPDHVNYVLGRETGGGRLIDPESNVTRAEVAAMLYRLLDEEVRSEYYRESSTFPDVEEGAWYEVPVATLQAMGIIKGDEGTGACRPNDPITRAEFAAMAGRFDDDGEWPDMEPFSDMDGHWAERIVLVAAVNGWILGDEGSDRFRPDDPITRAETIAITNRVLQRIPESEADLLPGRVEWPDNHDVEKWYWLAVEEATNNHDHTMKGDGVHERWTALLENEDWGE